MGFPKGMIKCSLLLHLCWACGCPSKVMTALSETRESPKLIPKKSVFWRVIAECLSITASSETRLNALSWLTCLCGFRLSIFNLFCVWLHIAHICHLLLWRSCDFFLRCHWALTTAKCGFRETAHQNTWRAKDCHYTTNGVFPSVASKNGFQLQPDLATDTVHPIFLAELDQSLISMCMNLGLVWQLLETCHPAPPSNLIASLINGRRRYF